MSPPIPDLPDLDRLLSERAWLRALARSLVVDQAAADDVAQEATVVALTRPPHRPEAMHGWLRRVVTNLAANRRRSEGRRATHETAAARPESSDDDPADVVVRWELRRQVVDAVLGLDEPYRSTVLLRFFEERTPDEIAERTGVPVETVRTRQRRALEMLRARLAHLDDGAGRRGLAVLLVLARPDAGGGGSGVVGGGAATGTAAAAMAGGALMTTVFKAALGVTLAAIVAAGVWVLRSDAGPDVARTTPVGGGQAADAQGPGRARAEKPHAPDASAPAAAAAAPVAPANPDTDIAGVVVDRDDRPVAGAEVVARDADRGSWMLAASRGEEPAAGRELARRTTAADGTFSIPVGEGADVLLRVSAAGFASTDAPGQQAGAQVRIVLAPATTLRVVVRDASGAPSPTAFVRVWGRSRSGTAWVLRTATTGADGTASWPGLPRLPGLDLRILVEPGSSRAAVEVPHTLADADVSQAIVSLPAGRTLEGRVLDAAAGVALAGAEIGTDARRPATARSDVSGAFTIEGWDDARPATERRVYARLPGYVPAWTDVPSAPHAPIEVRLRRGFEATGVVVREGGTALPGARVIGFERLADGTQSVVDTLTGPDGTFRLGAFGTPGVTLLVHADGLADVSFTVMTPPPATQVADVGTVVLGAGRTVRGSVVGADGAGQPGVQVDLRDAAVDRTGGWSVRRVTNTAGRFAFPRVAPGRYRLTANVATRPQPAADVAVSATTDPDPVVLSVAPVAGPALKYSVRTRVVDEDGNPVPRVRAFALLAANGDARGESGEGGELRIESASEPTCLSAYLDADQAVRYVRPWIWLRPGQTDVEFVLRRAEPVSGVVTDAEGNPAAQAWVEAHVGAKQVGAGSADAQGRFAFGVPPGATVRLSARLPVDVRRKGPPPFAELDDVRAGTTDLRLVVRPVTRTRSLDVTLVGELPPDAARPNVSLSWEGFDWQSAPKAAADDAGRARFDDVPCAPVRVHVQFGIGAARWVSTETRVDAAATSAEIALPRLRTLRGQVLDEKGAPVPSAAIFSTAGGAGSSARAEDDGRFVLFVPDGVELPYPVYANPGMPDPKSPRAGWDLVEDGPDRELRIVVKPVPAR